MGQYEIDLDEILSKGMIPVIRKRDIIKARILSIDEKKSAGRESLEIFVTSPLGHSYTMSKEDLINNYTYLNGRRINISGWKSTKERMVYRIDETAFLAIQIPINCTVDVNNKQVNKSISTVGEYIVAYQNNDGGPDPDKLGVITSAMFKKMFYMPPNDVITRNYGQGYKDFIPNESGNIHKEKGMDFVTPLGMGDFRLYTLADDSMDTSELEQTIQKPAQRPAKQTQQTQQTMKNKPVSRISIDKLREIPEQQKEVRYSAIGRLIDAGGSIIGFVIQNKKGEYRSVTKVEAMELSKQHLIDNISVGVKADTGKSFLRGNGIKISDLRAYGPDEII